jgi:ElaB/YqjD/DUF883 family membrane-anchored ribosome-binding protein
VTTLEDAAEELVVRLKGLDSEIEESQDEFEELRGRLEEVTRDVEEEWAHLAEVAESFLAKVQGEQEAMGTDVEAALQALGDAGRVLKEHGAEARGEIAEARSSVDLLAQRATGLEPGIESLVADGNEASLADLAQRAEEVERDLEQVVADTRAYLQGNLVAALEEMADAVRARCAAVRESLADRTAQALQVAFEKWEERVDQLEEYVATQAFERVPDAVGGPADAGGRNRGAARTTRRFTHGRGGRARAARHGPERRADGSRRVGRRRHGGAGRRARRAGALHVRGSLTWVDRTT